tara:strand:+ start:308 stop:649 length:342 start_codon:yes stop_codon:yes gene_type:complete
MATNIKTGVVSLDRGIGGTGNFIDLTSNVSIIDTRIRGFGYASKQAGIMNIADTSGILIQQPIYAVDSEDTIYFDALGIRVNGKVSMTMVSITGGGAVGTVVSANVNAYIFYG